MCLEKKGNNDTEEVTGFRKTEIRTLPIDIGEC